MKRLYDYKQVKDLLGKTMADRQLVYIIGDVCVSNTEINIEIWALDYDTKVCYLPFGLHNRLIKIK